MMAKRDFVETTMSKDNKFVSSHIRCMKIKYMK